MNSRFKIRKNILLAVKIGVGTSLAICIAETLRLRYATSAGIITLLTLITTKRGTFRLAFQRLLSYGVSVATCVLIFYLVESRWMEYGIFLFLLVLWTEWLEWRGTLSVNAVIGTHFLTEQDFSFAFIRNEGLLVVIGITIAIILNLFHMNRTHEQEMRRSMDKVEKEMQKILGEVAGYLLQESGGECAWNDVAGLEKTLEQCVEAAHEYQHNNFRELSYYYSSYFEMRMKQCGVLQSLHSGMQRIRQIPEQAKVVAILVQNIIPYVEEKNPPDKQITELEHTLERLRREPLPRTQEEFENRAELYHVLMDLEEFLFYKKRFLSVRQGL